MLQLIFGAFFIVFGATVVFMKKRELLDIILMGKSYQYESKLYKLDKFVIVIRILSGLVALIGIYICIVQISYMVVGN